jgi:hypothetical protein
MAWRDRYPSRLVLVYEYDGSTWLEMWRPVWNRPIYRSDQTSLVQRLVVLVRIKMAKKLFSRSRLETDWAKSTKQIKWVSVKYGEVEWHTDIKVKRQISMKWHLSIQFTQLVFAFGQFGSTGLPVGDNRSIDSTGNEVIIRLDCAGQLTDGFDVPSTSNHSVELLITMVLAIQNHLRIYLRILIWCSLWKLLLCTAWSKLAKQVFTTETSTKSNTHSILQVSEIRAKICFPH